MPREVPTLNLAQVEDRIAQIDNNNGDQTLELFHVFGIYRYEISRPGGHQWLIFDEHKEIPFRLGGNFMEYPRPKTGDIIRIHRSRINKEFKIAEIVKAINVIIWPAFQHDPKPISVAKTNTIDDTDNRRRRILEAYFCTRVFKPTEVLDNLHKHYDAVAGRVESITSDCFGHLEITLIDKKAKVILRVFRKIENYDDETHFNVASELNPGQYLVATVVGVDSKKRLYLSANTKQGRSIRPVEESSILGAKLTESLGTVDDVSQASTSSTKTNSSSNGSQGALRRSQRFAQKNQQDENRQEVVAKSKACVKSTETSNSVAPVEIRVSSPILPKYTLFSDIQRRVSGYDFYDIVGQVMDKPRLTPSYGNCVLQIFDGSRHDFINYFGQEVEHPNPGCLILLVYSKQKDYDTNEHLEKAMTLKEGDIVHVKNVKISFAGGKIKPELNANKSHDKSINVIDKRTCFGKKILDMALNPQVDELRDEIMDTSIDTEMSFPCD